MLKRKREGMGSSDRDKFRDDSDLRVSQSRLAARVEQGNVLLHRALKLARGFERQKLGRRQKNAKENPQELLRLKAEVIFLKQLELATAAENHLLKQLVRTKRIREASAFVSLCGGDAEDKVGAPKSVAEANVLGRLMNSNPVREVMPRIMSGIYGCLGLEGIDSNTVDHSAGNQPTTVERNVDRHGGDKSKDRGRVKLSPMDQDSQTDTSSDNFGGGSMAKDRRLAEAALDSQDSDEDEGMARFNGYIASSSASEGSDAEQDQSSRTRSLHTSGIPQPIRNSSLTALASVSPSPSPAPSISLGPRPSQHDTTAIPSSKLSTSRPPSNTTFLPSLTLGGYFSGSDSAADADRPSRHQTHASNAALALPQPRKNRRGQRARQQIAEKKYGRGAKHLQKHEQKQDRDAGWDSRMGATTAGGNAKERWKAKGRQSTRRTARGSKMTGVNVEPVTAKSKSKSKSTPPSQGNPVHPSWEAARKRKIQQQQQMQSATGLFFQGKKISFD